MVQYFNWFKASNSSMVQLVQWVQGLKGSRNQQIQELSEFNFLLFLPIKTKLASTAEPELGTAQSQLVIDFCHVSDQLEQFRGVLFVC